MESLANLGPFIQPCLRAELVVKGERSCKFDLTLSIRGSGCGAATSQNLLGCICVHSYIIIINEARAIINYISLCMRST